MIRLLNRNEIDETKWNALVARHPSGLPYAYTWFLDAATKCWRAFVLNDYEAVMPLPIAKKLGFSYVYQPDFCRQLGIFSLEKNAAITQAFYTKLNRHFWRYVVSQNTFFEPTAAFSKRPNFELSLNSPLKEIASGYNSNTKRNIAKAEKQNLHFETNLPIAEFSAFATVFSKFPIAEFQHFARVLAQHNALFLCAVRNEKNEIHAADLCIKSENRIMHTMPITSLAGRQNGAMHFLLHNLIRTFSEQNYVLDFEGSKIESIARFYRSFGAEEKFFYEKKRLA